MSTKREQILSHITEVMESNSLSVPVYRSRVMPFIDSQFPSIVIEPGEDPAQENVIGITNWSMNVIFAVYVKGNSPASEADPIIQEIHSKLFEDVSLGGRALDITSVGYKPAFGDGDVPWGIFDLIYRVDYRTKTNDLSA